MALFGHKFTFDGIPSEQFDLMLYDVGGSGGDDAEFASTVDIVEDVVSSKWRPLFYGVRRGKKLSFTIVMGVNMRRVDEGKFLDRYEMSEVATWLTGHDEYKDLEIEQPDLRFLRYRCMISALTPISFGNIPWALQATVTCDSPFAYMEKTEQSYPVNGTARIIFDNLSAYSGMYMPEIEFDISSGDGFSIENETDNGRTLTFAGLPGAVQKVYVDNERCIITNDQDLNIYDMTNMKWLRFKRGQNILNVVGNGTLIIKCEFPVNVGG